MSINASLRANTNEGTNTFPILGNKILLSYADELSLLVNRFSSHDDTMKLVANVLHGYFLLRMGYYAQALLLIEAASQLINDRPVIVRFPLLWMMASCTLEGLKRFGRTEMAKQLKKIMQSMASQLKFSNKCSFVGAEMLAVYSEVFAFPNYQISDQQHSEFMKLRAMFLHQVWLTQMKKMSDEKQNQRKVPYFNAFQGPSALSSHEDMFPEYPPTAYKGQHISPVNFFRHFTFTDEFYSSLLDSLMPFEDEGIGFSKPKNTEKA
mmetsp:Transcript_15036/g.21349  ORF Transcript_15036/g.21349 Transcript_15036/m.21349 type:complete len:265 (-) Transcript_15036:24-818(-)